MAKLQITYTKSAIGYSKDQKATIASLGLRKLNSTVMHDDTPAIRGMAFKVRHLVTVTEVTDEQPASRPAKPKPTVTEATPARAAAAPAPKADAGTPAKAEAAAGTKVKSYADDDLEAIEGIGPKIAGVLKAAGVVTFADLAAADTNRLTEILQAANVRLADPTTWPEQAQLAAEGKWGEFKALQESLKGGRRD
jgi:large subunit ribosomal protein L21